MLTNAPWLNVNPLDFVGAAAKGADLGLRASQIATGANEAADRLRLSYAQLAAEQSMHAATTGAAEHRASAELALHAALAKQANDARLARIGIAGQHQNMLEENAADRLHQLGAERLLHVGQGVYGYDPKTGGFSTKLAPKKELDPVTRAKLGALIKRQTDARKALHNPDLDEKLKPSLQAELDDATGQIQAISDQWEGKPSSAADALRSTPETPWSASVPGWDTSTTTATSLPSLDSGDGGGDAGGGGTGVFKVGKYSVTPLK